MDRYNWQVFHGGVNDPRTLPDGVDSWWGDHDNACSAPPAPGQATGNRREVHVHPETEPTNLAGVGDMVWWCAPGSDPTKGHFMTAVDTVGYASIAWSPPQTFHDVTRICWDMSLAPVSAWWLQLDVIPEAVFQANGGDLFYEENSEVAFAAHDLRDGSAMLEMIKGSTAMLTSPPAGSGFTVDANYGNVEHVPGFPLEDRAKRYKHCLVDNGGVTLERGFPERVVQVELYGRYPSNPSFVEVRTLRGALPNGPVRVIFEHSSYHNSKDACCYDQATQDGKTLGDGVTVHWDNITVE